MQNAQPTKAQIKGVIEVTMAIGDAIRSLKSVPSGELYARLMPSGITLESYNAIIDTLVKAKVIKNEGHLLTWIGPTAKAEVAQ